MQLPLGFGASDDLLTSRAQGRAVNRRVEQQRKFTNEPPGRPIQLQQKIEKRLIDRVSSRYADKRPVFAINYLEAERIQDSGPINSRTPEGFEVRQIDIHRVKLGALH